jgi:type I restriction enzyme S subunit
VVTLFQLLPHKSWLLQLRYQLLPQDPTDEPAALLLKKLQAARAATGKGGKGKAGALFAEEAEVVEGPFDIPASWVWCKLEDVTTVIAGASFESSAFKEKGTKAIKITNVGVGCFVETEECLPNDFVDSYSQFLIRKQDILIALTRPYIKDGLNVCVCPDSYDGSLLNQRVAAVKEFTRAIDRHYLYYYLSSQIVLDYIKAECGTDGQQPNLKMGTITGLQIPLPPLAEQHRIVTKLEQLLQHCDSLEQRIRESRRLAEQLLQTALREALAPPAGVEEYAEEEPELATADEPASMPVRRGRPRRPSSSLENPLPDLFSDLFPSNK